MISKNFLIERLQRNEQNGDFIPHKNLGSHFSSDFQRQYLNQFLSSNFYIVTLLLFPSKY